MEWRAFVAHRLGKLSGSAEGLEPSRMTSSMRLRNAHRRQLRVSQEVSFSASMWAVHDHQHAGRQHRCMSIWVTSCTAQVIARGTIVWNSHRDLVCTAAPPTWPGPTSAEDGGKVDADGVL